MSNQERYDELDNFISTLKLLKDELYSKDLIAEIDYILFNTNYLDEKDELEELLAREYETDLRDRENEYWKSQF